MKKFLCILCTIFMLIAENEVARAENWGQFFDGMNGLLGLVAEETDDSLPSFDDAFDGPIIEVEIGHKKGKIHESFKIALDKYEEFFDEYIEFMQNPDMLHYMEFMTKYLEAMENLDTLDEHEMSDWESLYYTEVLLRIDNKLFDALDDEQSMRR